MYDPLSGEGLVCVNGRCISNKRKFQVHDEKHIGLQGGNRRRNAQGGGQRGGQGGRRRRGGGAAKRQTGRGRHNGIPMNPYENLDNIIDEEDEGYDEAYFLEDAEADDNELMDDEDEYGDENDLVPFQDQEDLLDESYREGNVYNYSGNKKQQP